MSVPLVKVAGAFSETAIDQEIVVMSLGTGDFFSLTGSAAAIWRLIDGTRDCTALISAVADEFAADQATLAADVEPFLAQLIAAGLVRGD
jgi:hypothetical protein